MSDIEFSLNGLEGRNIQKILYLPDSDKVLIWHNNKPVSVDVDLKNMITTIQNLDTVFNGSVDSETKQKLVSILTNELTPYMADNTKNGNGKGKTNVQIAFESVRQQARDLFIDELKIPYIAIPIQDHLEIMQVNSNAFKNWYRMYMFEQKGIILDSTTINDTCGLASAYASSTKYGHQINLNLRTALNNNSWCYDLVNSDWEFIRITSNDWYISKNEIIFRRFSNQKAQVYPERNYESDIFDKFMKLVNIKQDDNDSKLLLKVYIISLCIPEIQKVVLMLHGSQGSAKSSLQELIRMLVDPSITKTLTLPTNIMQLIQQLSHNYVAYYDNVSTIRGWISNQLCMAVTGSASSTRVLFSDDDDFIRSFKRCIGINGINIASNKADLLDRSIIIKLERILNGKQKTPKEIWESFEAIKPQLLGYIFDILVKVLQYEENNTNEKYKMTRMTEFSKFGEIISRCMGNKDNEFLEAYERNRQIQVDEIIESSQLATVIICMMFRKYGESEGEYLEYWDGTPTTLLGEINNIVETPKWNLNIDMNDRYFPTKANSLSRRLNEIIPTLREKGLEITLYKESNKERTRKIKIVKITSELSELSESQNQAQNQDKTSDDITDDMNDTKTELSEKNTKIHAQNDASDEMDEMDDIEPTSIEKSGSHKSLRDCYYCTESFDLDSDYQKHVLNNHKGKLGYPNKAYLEKYGIEPRGMDWEQE